MIYLSDAFIDQLLLDDIQYGDLTTQALNIGTQPGTMTFNAVEGGCVSGIHLALRMLQKLGLSCESFVCDGDIVEKNTLLIKATGRADALHQGWKAVQNVLEWCSGVSHYTWQMMEIIKRYQPNGQLACTRKTIPNTKLLAISAIQAGGAHIHRLGTSDTILLFTNHRRFLAEPDDWSSAIKLLRQDAPEKMVVVEADDYAQAVEALKAEPDLLQLDKFTPDELISIQQLVHSSNSQCRLSAAGGINLRTIEQYAQTGISLFITSAPYYAAPRDIKVHLKPK